MDLSFSAREVTEDTLVVSVAQALHDDGSRGRLGDTAEVLRGVVELANGVAVFVLVHGHDGDATGLLVDFDAGLGDGSGQVVIRLEQGFFDGINEGFELTPFSFSTIRSAVISISMVSYFPVPKSTRERAFLMS